MLQVSSNTLQHVKKFQYLEIVFTSNWKQSKNFDTRCKCSSLWDS